MYISSFFKGGKNFMRRYNKPKDKKVKIKVVAPLLAIK